MEAITVTKESNGFKVQQGNKWADALCYDEMMGLVSSLTMPERRPCLQWMLTKEQHEAREASIRESIQNVHTNK